MSLKKERNVMKEISIYSELREYIDKEEYMMVYFTSPTCGVCEADLPYIEKMIDKNEFPAFRVRIEKVPEASAQLNVFTGPAVLLFYKGREYHRQAGVIYFREVERYIKELLEQ